MSAIYNLEPQPTASVIIHTTQGELSVELWAKQAPLTCRNFLQLALDGYYDNTIFHRLIPGFILQGGDPTGTGNGGESIYDGGAFSDELDPWPMDQRHGKNAGPTGVGFRDEFHSRLKFNRRGLLGMANESKPDTNGSQFFFTLDKTEELTNKNTLFGRIMGDTIYNLAKMGEAELHSGTERPMYPMKITSVEILVNPFANMKKRQRVAAPQTTKTIVVDRKKKRKGGKQLLSFEDENGDDEVAPLPKKAKFDNRIVMDVDEEPPVKTKKAQKEKKAPKASANDAGVANGLPEVAPSAVQPRRDSPARASSRADAAPPVKAEHESSPEPAMPTRKSAAEKANEEFEALKASMKRNANTAPVQETTKKSALESMIPETSIKGRKRRTGGANGAPTKEDQKALDFLKAFQSRLDDASAEERAARSADKGKGIARDDAAGAEDEAELCDLHFIAGCESCSAWHTAEKGAESDDEGWMAHTWGA